MDDAIEQRRLTRTIVNGVDVGLVAHRRAGCLRLDEPPPRGVHEARLSRRARGLGRPGRLRLRSRRGHHARAATTCRRFGRSAERPSATPDLGRRGPGRATCAGGLLHAVLPHQRGLRRSRARLPRHHRAGARLPDQGGVRRLGQPRAAHAADLDHRLRRHHARRGGAPALGRARLPRHACSATPAGCTASSTTCSRRRSSRSRPSSTSSRVPLVVLLRRSALEAQPGRGRRRPELRVRRVRGAERPGDPRRQPSGWPRSSTTCSATPIKYTPRGRSRRRRASYSRTARR